MLSLAVACSESFDVTNRIDSGGSTSSTANADANGGSGGTPSSAGSPAVTEPPAPPRQTACGLPRANDPTALDAEICIEGARFVLGSSEPLPANSQGLAVHSPAHEVAVSSFFLDAHEVSVGRYRACVDAGVCAVPRVDELLCTYTPAAAENELLPVTCVSWSEALDFCEWDEARRLPSEAEWELAARGVAGRKYAWGEAFDCGSAAIGASDLCGEHDASRPLPIGSLPRGRTPEGAFDMTGNAAEWVFDWVGTYPATFVTDPLGPNSGGAKVVRGGSWRDLAAFAPAYLRRTMLSEGRGPSGLRCARNASSATDAPE